MPLLLSKDEFKLQLQLGEPVELARMFVLSDTVHALPHAGKYQEFREKVLNYLPYGGVRCDRWKRKLAL